MYHLQDSNLFVWSCLHTVYAVQQWVVTSLIQYYIVSIERGVLVCQFFHAIPPTRMQIDSIGGGCLLG